LHTPINEKAPGQEAPQTTADKNGCFDSNPAQTAAQASPPAGRCCIGVGTVHVWLELVEARNGATAVAHSYRDRDGRMIRIRLCAGHVLVSRLLARADAFAIRFLVSLSLIEYCLYWNATTDGHGVQRALRELAGYAATESAWGSSFASRLAISEPMRALDSLPIFGRTPTAGPHALFDFKAALRTPSDIRGWRMRNGESESLDPLPPKSPKKTAREPAKPFPEPSNPPAPTPEQRFAAAFLATVRETLDQPSIKALEQFTRERLGEPTSNE
jgi:hypothetical protein